jgi:DUF971 family protein
VPDVRVTLKLSFEHGDEQVLTAGAARVTSPTKEAQGPNLPPYRVPKRTACDEPTLIESASFVKVG